MKNFKNISFFASSSIALNVTSLISGFIVYRWIDPYNIGIWQTLLLFDTYSTFLRFGVINGMNRELPFQMGQGNKELALKYASVTLFHVLGIICLLILISPVLAYKVVVSGEWVFPVLAIVAVVALKFYNSYLVATFRAENEFNNLSKIQFVHAVLRLVTILFVYFWHFNGFLIREIFVLAVITALTHVKKPLDVKPKFDLPVLKELLKTGLPIFIASYLFNFFYTAPRLVLLKWGTVEMLGIYAPVFTFLTAMAILPDSFSSYFYPKMSHQLGKSNDKSGLWKKSLYVSVGLIAAGIPLAIAGMYAGPYIIDNFLPMYTRTKEILDVGLLIGLFMSFKFGLTTLNSLKAWKHIALFISLFGILQFALPVLMLNYLNPLKAVVWGQLIATVIMCFVSLGIVYHATTVYRTA